MATGGAAWSQTAASNASADSNANWAEGMAPSQVNDSARAIMASVAKWRDDIGAGIFTTGGPTNYVITTNQGFASLSALALKPLLVYFNVTNAINPTLNADGLGAKSIFMPDGINTPQAAFIQPGSYLMTYSVSAGGFYINQTGIQNFLHPGIITLYASGATRDGWAGCSGVALSRTTYANLFNEIGTTYGSSDGLTFRTPNLANVSSTAGTISYQIKT